MAIDNEGVNIVITGDSSKAVQEIRKVEASVNGLLSLEVGKSLEATFGTVFKTITSTLQSVARAVSGVMKNALSIGGGFESQMTSVKVISGATAEELDALTKKAREMGATLPITAKDAATAMTLLAQRGNDANKILASVNAVSNLAVSQAVDMASAADILGSTITNFAMSVDDADRITAIFNNACNQSALSMSKLIEAMKYVGPAAGAVDMELTEAVSAMEAIANAGLTGEMTGTGLAMVLSKLAAKSHILGVDTKNLDGSLRDIADIFSELKQKGFSLADAIAAFGQRGSKATLALAKNSASLKANQERLKQWDSTQNAVNEKMKTFTNTLNAFRSASEELHIEIFEQIKNQAKEAVGSIADLTRQFSKWIGETQIAGKALDAFLKGLGFNIPNADSFQKLLNSFNVQSFLDSIQSFGSAIKGIADGIVSAFSLIKAPLLFLIEHLGTFATISFWGWIIGKGLQVPAAILSIASAFKTLYASAQLLLSLSWTSFLNPMTIVVGAGTAVAYYAGGKIAEAEKAERDFNDTIKRIQNEIRDADSDLSFSINFDFKTGFEKLPDSYIKASDELRAKTNETVKVLQAAFKDKVAAAVDSAAQKFPNLAAEVVQSGVDIDNLSNDILRQISAVFHGSEEEFKKLHPFFKQVIDDMNSVTLGSKDWNSAVYNITKTYKQLQAETDKLKPQNKVKTFYEELSANLRNVFANLPKQIEEANKFLNGSDGQLAINVSLEKAKSQLDAFVKQAADKFAIPEDIVKQSTINKLQELANQGNKTAQALIKAWGKADTSVEDFIDKAKEAISYLGASPQHFLPALNSMLKGIQRIDPVTGKLTEQFKKAHDALKEWANVTFDKLSNRIQKLRKAVEGGFIDSSALEKEFKNVLPQIKLQVVSDLEPIKNQFTSQRDYQATLASEFVSKVNDLFGDLSTQLLRNLYNDKSGVDIGRSIINEIQRAVTGSQGTININGIEQSLTDAINPLVNAFGQSDSMLSPVNSSLQLLNNSINNNSNAVSKTGDSILSLLNSIRTPTSTANSGAAINYSALFANVIKELVTLNSSAKDNICAVNSVADAVRSIQLQPIDDANLARTILDALNPMVATVDKLQSATDNISSTIVALSGNIDALKSSTDISANAMGNLQSALSSAQNEQNSSASIAPFANSLQNLDASLASILAVHQDNSKAITDVLIAVNNLQKVLAALSSGNTFNIDIQQQGFIIERKSDADSLARSTASAIRSGLGNGGV